MQRLIAKPAMASQETQNLFGKLTEDVDSTGLVDINNGQRDDKPYQDMFNINDTINADQNTQVPERGVDFADIASVPQAFYDWNEDQVGNTNVATRLDRARAQFGFDAMPPDGAPYTQGDSFPTSPKDGDYHRLTYTSIRSGIPARLHRYSSAKEKWIFLEKDRRAEFKNIQSKITQHSDPDYSTVTPPNDKDAFYKA
jgi:hypothetical protein